MKNRAPRLREKRTAGTAFAPVLAAVLDVSRLDRRGTLDRERLQALQETEVAAGNGSPRSGTVRTDRPTGGAIGSRSNGSAGEILRCIRETFGSLAREQGVLLVTTSTTRADLDIDVEAVVAVLSLTVEAGIRRAATGGARVVVGVRPGPGDGLTLVVRDTGLGDAEMDPRVQHLVTALNGRGDVQGNSTGTRVALSIPAAGRVSAA